MHSFTHISAANDNNVTLRRVAKAIWSRPKVKYLAYIRSDAWRQRRRQHLEEQDYWCEVCHKDMSCQVHHVTYARLGFELPKDLVAVCVACHHKLHCMVLPTPANDNTKQLDMFKAG